MGALVIWLVETAMLSKERVVPKTVPFGEPTSERATPLSLKLTPNPEHESVRGFRVSGRPANPLRQFQDRPVFSVFGESERATNANVEVATSLQREPPKLSDSLVNNPLWVNTSLFSHPNPSFRTSTGYITIEAERIWAPASEPDLPDSRLAAKRRSLWAHPKGACPCTRPTCPAKPWRRRPPR